MDRYQELLEAITQLRDEWARTDFPDEQTANSMQLDLARVVAPFEVQQQ